MKKTLNCIYWLFKGSSFRPKGEFLASRIIQASCESNLAGFLERLGRTLDSGPLQSDALAEALAEDGPDERRILALFRERPNTVVSLAYAVGKDPAALDGIDMGSFSGAQPDKLLPPARREIPITFRTLSPLAHGGDEKAGNATLFRRRRVLAANGATASVPYYAGNAFRGQLRDAMAWRLLRGLGLDEPKKVALWFLHLLFSGGSLGNDKDPAIAKAAKAAGQKIHGFSVDFRLALREALPPVSLLGGSLGNMMFPGRLCVGDFSVSDLDQEGALARLPDMLSWEFATRRDDSAAWGGAPKDDDNKSMIVSVETVVAGVEFEGGLDLREGASEVERAALAQGLASIRDAGRLGANTNRGYGRVDLRYDWDQAAEPYETYLADRKEAILAALDEMGAINAGD